METEEITKLVDGIYKNILDKFNPGARQLISAGKAYLKALHGAAAASKLYVESIARLAKQAQQATWGASADVSSALMQIVDVYKEIQAQQMNILKAFYVDLLVPLETNLEKDTKVVQSEQKRFLAQHKLRFESYSKAVSTIKKQRKKTRAKPGVSLDREVKSLQVLEEERAKLDAFCETSLKTAMTQERRRYGFVLERQCSLAKHYLLHHSQSSQSLEERLEGWQEVSQSRETLPEAVETVLSARLRQVSLWPSEEDQQDLDDDRMSISSQQHMMLLRKTKSMDASCQDLRAVGDSATLPKPLSRAKSDFNLTASTNSLLKEASLRPKSMAVPSEVDNQLARALYAYHSNGENQLSFLEGDIIALQGERNKGWQFGENLRTQCTGWFPLAYTEMLLDGVDGSPPPLPHSRDDRFGPSQSTPTTPAGRSKTLSCNSVTGKAQHPETHAKTLHPPLVRQGGRTLTTFTSACPPPPQPAPVPRRLLPPPPLPPLRSGGATTSLHSSNDSGFSNDPPPPAPEVDYSDDENSRTKPSKLILTSINKHKLRGWLSSKSTPTTDESWDDPSHQHRRLAQQSSTLGHLATLGRISAPKRPERELNSTIKRTRSLWKFRRNNHDVVLEGMALWQHRSLVDIPKATAQEEKKKKKPEPPTTVAVQTDEAYVGGDSDDGDGDDSDCYLVIEDQHRKADGVGGLMAYGQSLKKRLSKPDRGSRFDQRSQTTGNMCGPWYDLWGLDASVK